MPSDEVPRTTLTSNAGTRSPEIGRINQILSRISRSSNAVNITNEASNLNPDANRSDLQTNMIESNIAHDNSEIEVSHVYQITPSSNPQTVGQMRRDRKRLISTKVANKKLLKYGAIGYHYREGKPAIPFDLNSGDQVVMNWELKPSRVK